MCGTTTTTPEGSAGDSSLALSPASQTGSSKKKTRGSLANRGEEVLGTLEDEIPAQMGKTDHIELARRTVLRQIGTAKRQILVGHATVCSTSVPAVRVEAEIEAQPAPPISRAAPRS